MDELVAFLAARGVPAPASVTALEGGERWVVRRYRWRSAYRRFRELTAQGD